MKPVLLVAFLLLMALPASAEERVMLHEIVVTATRIEEPIGEISSGVTVITHSDIRKMNVTFLPDVFRQIPGLHVIQYGGPGKVASVLFRGGNSSHALVLIDGIRANSTATGGFDFSGISVDNIERIEIVKGPQSTAYGSDAMAGVISIITKKGDGDIKADVSLEAGSNETLKTTGTIAGSRKTTDFRLTATHFRTAGFSAAASGNERDGYRNSSLSGKAGFQPADALRFEVAGAYSYDRSELDGFDFSARTAADDLNFVQSGHHALFSGRAMLRLSDAWNQTLRISLAKDSINFRDADTVFNNAKIDTSAMTADWQHNIFPARYYSVVAGIEYRKEKGNNHGNFDESLENYAVFINNKLKLFDDAFVVTAGARYDDRDASGTKATCRFGAVYNLPSTDATIRAGYGTGFRAPALNELFFPFYGNRDLKPEETESWEIGLSNDFFSGRLRISMTYFDQKYENLILTDPETYTAANIAAARVKGIETSAAADVSDLLKLKAGYIHLNSEDRNSGKQLPLRPRDKVTVTAEVSNKNSALVADYLFAGKRFDSSARRTLSSYSVINMSGSCKVSKELTLFIRAENILDEKYEETGSYATPGFSLHGGIRVLL